MGLIIPIICLILSAICLFVSLSTFFLFRKELNLLRKLKNIDESIVKSILEENDEASIESVLYVYKKLQPTMGSYKAMEEAKDLCLTRRKLR